MGAPGSPGTFSQSAATEPCLRTVRGHLCATIARWRSFPSRVSEPVTDLSNHQTRANLRRHDRAEHSRCVAGENRARLRSRWKSGQISECDCFVSRPKFLAALVDVSRDSQLIRLEVLGLHLGRGYAQSRLRTILATAWLCGDSRLWHD